MIRYRGQTRMSPTPGEVKAMEAEMQRLALELTGSDAIERRYAIALNLLVEAANGVSTGFMRLTPDVIPTPRQRPEPL